MKHDLVCQVYDYSFVGNGIFIYVKKRKKN